MLALGLADKLPNFGVDLSRLDGAVDLVVETTKRNYPTLNIPFHSRWRHFVCAGRDRWATLDKAANWRDGAARARAAFDLAIVSVLLDAGAGSQWRYRDPATEQSIGHSEGLALASLEMFARSDFAANEGDPLRADAEKLIHLSNEAVRNGLQVSDANPLVGTEGRAGLLRRLGALVAAKPEIFALRDSPRPGGLFDRFVALAANGEIAAGAILVELLRCFSPIWPSRLTLGGVPLGDCWRHPSLTTADATTGLMPLHKLSQWLTYSLIEPLQAAGLTVFDIDALTGLAEYRNGGLFIDMGVLELRDPQDAGRAHDVASALVVEWRALTVALLDRLARVLRERTRRDAVSLPLAKILQGGTWAAGRQVARERRADGSPPLRVVSDGTVF